jgi:CheY-like chemotaxis protein
LAALKDKMLEIVIVDDAKEDRLLTERVIRQCKIINPITIFDGGDDLIAYFNGARATEPEKPAIILIDLIMAPVSGLDVLRYWRNSRFARNTFLVMVSGLNDLKAINEGYQLGGRTFLLKPVAKDDLVQVLNSFSDLLCIEKEAGGYSLHWIDQLAEPASRSQPRQMIALSK